MSFSKRSQINSCKRITLKINKQRRIFKKHQSCIHRAKESRTQMDVMNYRIAVVLALIRSAPHQSRSFRQRQFCVFCWILISRESNHFKLLRLTLGKPEQWKYNATDHPVECQNPQFRHYCGVHYWVRKYNCNRFSPTYSLHWCALLQQF